MKTAVLPAWKQGSVGCAGMFPGWMYMLQLLVEGEQWEWITLSSLSSFCVNFAVFGYENFYKKHWLHEENKHLISPFLDKANE